MADSGETPRDIALLSLDDTADDEDDLATEGLQAFSPLCGECPKLEQLAVKWPKPGRGFWSKNDGLSAFLDCLTGLSSLKTLRLFTYLEDNEEVLAAALKSSTQALHLLEQGRAAQMQEQANKIFSKLSHVCPLLAVLAIDARRSDQDCGSPDVERHGFLRAQQTSMHGHTTVVGIPMEPHMIKHYASCCKILDD
ncbi:hypothetical protein LTR36_009511 [Oleoguttula mirabilis]|uniref:Uncharacterized protein n=1 Tax=Oleoguttula mirabilis TaxID=1507867 RepID=A0AAV9JSP7_9PEZI|nr:hypothetical protein LTR36_009511 [Oleoguttula mirabilis]